jgi:hypothetical protein
MVIIVQALYALKFRERVEVLLSQQSPFHGLQAMFSLPCLLDERGH